MNADCSPYRVREDNYPSNIELLTELIRKEGIKLPITCVEDENGCLTILDGLARLHAAHLCNLKVIPTIIVTIEPYSAVELAIRLNAGSQRPLSRADVTIAIQNSVRNILMVPHSAVP